MLEKLKEFYRNIHSKNVYTWIGHFVAGFILTMVFNPEVAAVTFAYREGSDFLGWWKDPRTEASYLGQFENGKNFYKKPRMEVFKDGFFDLVSPVLGAAAATAVKYWLGWL